MPINKIQFQQGLPLPEFFDQFGTEAQCEQALEQARWPGGFVCPRCGSGRWWQCSACRKQTSLTAGTIFESTRLPLRLWFPAIYHLTQPKTTSRRWNSSGCSASATRPHGDSSTSSCR